jgi:ankyrin repeat protein
LQVVEMLAARYPRLEFIDAPDKLGRTALHFAAARGDAHMCRILLAQGATLKANRRNRTPAHVAASAGHTQLATLLADGSKVSGILVTVPPPPSPTFPLARALIRPVAYAL